MPTLYLILIGGVTAYFAKRQGRNPLIWFAIGCFLPSFSLALLFILPIIGYFFKRKFVKTLNKAARSKKSKENDPLTINVPPFPDLNPSEEAIKKLWYFLDQENQTVGPMSFFAFYQKWKEGKIASKTFVWNDSLSEWKQFKEIFPQGT